MFSQTDFKVDARLVRDGESTSNYKVTKSGKFSEIEKILKGVEEDDEKV